MKKNTKAPHQSAGERASGQHGAIAHAQALEEGLSRRQIQHLVKSGQWRRAAPGVYVVAGSPATWQQKLTVACLAGPPGTVASHRSAAALFGFCDPPETPEITVPPRASSRRSGTAVHRSRVDEADRCKISAIPATTPARTLVDCAAQLSLDDLCDLVDTGCYKRKSLPRRIQEVLRRVGAQGRKGTRALQEALGPWTSGVRPGSPAEARCVRAFARWGLPEPARQYVVRDENGQFVARSDFAWPDDMVLFEYDGEEYHGPRAWEADAAREQKVDALGWTIERGDKEDFRPSATALRDRLRKLLRGRDAS